MFRTAVGAFSLALFVVVVVWMGMTGGAGAFFPFAIGLLLVPGALGTLLLFRRNR